MLISWLLRSYCAADPHLCFHICEKQIFSRGGLVSDHVVLLCAIKYLTYLSLTGLEKQQVGF